MVSFGAKNCRIDSTKAAANSLSNSDLAAWASADIFSVSKKQRSDEPARYGEEDQLDPSRDDERQPRLRQIDPAGQRPRKAEADASEQEADERTDEGDRHHASPNTI